MNRVILEESFKKLNEEDNRDVTVKEAKKKVRSFLEKFYENWLEEVYADSGITVQELAGIDEYDPDWCPADYIEELSIIDDEAMQRIIDARVEADMQSLFFYADK